MIIIIIIISNNISKMWWYIRLLLTDYLQNSLNISEKEEKDELERFIRKLGYNMENVDMKHIIYVLFFYIFIDIDHPNSSLFNFNNLIKTHLKKLVLLTLDVSKDKILNIMIPVEWSDNETFLIYIKEILFKNEHNFYYDFIVKIVMMYKNIFPELLQIYFGKLFSHEDGVDVIFNFQYEPNNTNNDIESACGALLSLHNFYKKNEFIII
jgi:hypothetical protein